VSSDITSKYIFTYINLCKDRAVPELPFASVSKQVFLQNLSYENEPRGREYFLMKGFAGS